MPRINLNSIGTIFHQISILQLFSSIEKESMKNYHTRDPFVAHDLQHLFLHNKPKITQRSTLYLYNPSYCPSVNKVSTVAKSFAANDLRALIIYYELRFFFFCHLNRLFVFSVCYLIFFIYYILINTLFISTTILKTLLKMGNKKSYVQYVKKGFLQVINRTVTDERKKQNHIDYFMRFIL